MLSDNPTRLVVLAQHFPPDGGACANRMHALCLRLARRGYDVHVISSTSSYPTGTVVPSHRGRLVLCENVEGMRVTRCYTVPSRERSIPRKGLNHVSYGIAAALASLFAERPAVVLATTPPTTVGLPALTLSLLKAAPLVLDVRDKWPEIGEALGYLRSRSAMYRSIRAMERALYRRASFISVVTRNDMQVLIDSGAPRSKIVYMPNGVDADAMAAVVPQRLPGTSDKTFVIIYAGLVGRAQDLSILARLALRLRDVPECLVAVIGDGPEKRRLANLAESLGLGDSFRMLPWTHPAQARSWVAGADLCVVPLRSDALENTVPSKMLEALGLGKAVVFCGAGEGASVLTQAEAGTVVPPGDDEALAVAVRLYCQNRERLRQHGRNGAVFVRACFNWDNIAIEMDRTLRMAQSHRQAQGGRHG